MQNGKNHKKTSNIKQIYDTIYSYMNKNYNLQLQSSKSYVIITTEAEGFAECICDLNKIVDFRYYAPNTSLRGIKQMLYMQVRTNKNFLERRILKWQVRQKRPQRCFSHL